MTRRNSVIATLLVGSYANVFAFSLFGPLYGVYVIDLGFSAFHVGIASAVYAGVLGLALLIFGRWEDSHHRTSTAVIAGYAMMTVGALGYVVMDSLSDIIIVQVWNALGTAVFTPAWKALYTMNEDRGREATEWANVDGGNMLIAGAAIFLGGTVATLFGYQVLFYLMAGVQCLGMMVALRLVRRRVV